MWRQSLSMVQKSDWQTKSLNFHVLVDIIGGGYEFFIAGQTDVGIVKSTNQDSLLVKK